ncbi:MULTISPECIES: hypothetical protein [unclassified Mesorhizobium]|uniref:hypothetical protein n=1 Tax=unclassified Mesorhizobium TaxID=325217 RepID=UPI00142F009F|nr:MULTISPECIES: hypothetical protein [unclassified Mesorhizobium]
MSVLGILLHFSRTVIEAHNNAKVRNLMDAPHARTEAGKERPATDGEGLSAQRRDR